MPLLMIKGGTCSANSTPVPCAIIPHLSRAKHILCAKNTGLTPAVTQLLKQLSHRGDGGGVARECGVQRSDI